MQQLSPSGTPEAPRLEVDPLEIDAAMIRGLYHRVKPLIVANFGALILLTIALWDATARLPLLTWATALGLWTMLRFVLARVYMRRERALEETRRWTLAFACGSTVAGCLWGSSVVFVGDLDSDNTKLVTAFLMAALSAAAIAGYTNSLLAFAGFIAPALVPYAWRLINLGDTPSLMVTAFVAFWGLLLWIMARHLNEGFRDSIALSYRNRNLAEQWRVQRDRAEAASQAKSRFLGHMSHELRTPLNAVIGYADMIAQKILGPLGNDSYETYARDIRDSGRHMLSMVDSILDLSAAESGGLDMETRPTELSVVLASALAVAEPEALAKDLALTCSLPEEIPSVEGNADRLLQLAVILIDNAVKYSEPGGRVTVSATEAEGGWVELRIADDGIGMDAELVATVQQPFKLIEGQDHLTRSAGADSGQPHTTPRLSLPLAKLLAEAHGGSLAIDSRPGAGTCVTIRLPRAGASTAARRPVAAADPPAVPDRVAGLSPAGGE